MTNEIPKVPTFDPGHYATSGDIANLAAVIRETQQTLKIKSPSNIGYKIITIILLIVIAGALAFNQFHKSSLTAECQSAIAQANVVIAEQHNVINSQLSDYEKAVYDDSGVDNIYKQIFRTNEYEFSTLNIIAIQNAALLDITTNCK